MTDPAAAEPCVSPQADADARFMAAALAFARRGLGRTGDNPAVGALLVRDGIVVGRGRTADGGRPHAEVAALAQAGEAARGATLYVTLEPCSHQGRSPPCCEALVGAGVARIVFAVDDPNPLVAGQGAAFCRASGLQVLGGVGAAQARIDHLGHFRRVAEGRPMVTLKLAETADGFVAGGPHDGRLAITGAPANGMVHAMRSMHDAIMVGIGTVVADDPLMTVRLPGVASRPPRIVLDAELAITPRSRLVLTAAEAPLLVVAREGAAPPPGLDVPGVEILFAPVDDRGLLNLAAILSLLAARGHARILSEGGPRTAAALIVADLVDEVCLFTAPRPLGRDGVPGLSASSRDRLAQRFELAEDREVGTDRLRRFVREG